MDALAGLLDGPGPREAFLLRSVMDPPWSLRIEDEAPLTLVAVVRGEAWIVPDGGDPVSLTAGAVALVRGPGHYTVADAPDRTPLVVIHPGQVCTTLAGEPLVEAMALGVRTWGNSPNGSTVLLTGTYQHRSELSAPLLDALPAVVALPAERLGEPARGAAGRGDRPGRTRAGRRARPPARPAADRRAPRLVRTRGPRRPEVVPGLRRSGRRAGAAAAAQQPGARVDGGSAGRGGRACHGRRWPAGSTTSWGNRR